MRTVSVAEAKSNLSEILNQVQDGEEIIVTRRGRPVARIAPVQKPLKPLESRAKFRARVRKMKSSTKEVIRQMRDEGY